MWGDGKQTRSFLYIDECLEGVHRLMGPVNISSDEMVSINKLVEMARDIPGKKQIIKHIPGPLGVRGRNSENTLIKINLDGRLLKVYMMDCRKPMYGLQIK